MVLDTLLAGARGLSFYHHSGDQTSGGGVAPTARFAATTAAGPAAEVGTAFVPTIYPGHYSIYATPRDGRSLTEVEAAIMAAISEAAGSISDDEVTAARRRIAAADSIETDSPVEIAHEMAFWTALGGPEARRRVLDAVGVVTTAEVRALAAGLTPTRAAIGMLLPPVFAAGTATSGASGSVPSGSESAAAAGRRGAPQAGAASAPCRAVMAGAPARARRHQVTTHRLSMSGRGPHRLTSAQAIVDARPDLATFVLRFAIAPSPAGLADDDVVARLRAAASALADDDPARTAAAACGFALGVVAPGQGRFDERDTLQVEATGPADTLGATITALEGAIGRALRAESSGSTVAATPPGTPDALALYRLDAAVREAHPGARSDATAADIRFTALRFTAALVAPYDAGAVTPRLGDLARQVDASLRRWPRPAVPAGAPAARPATTIEPAGDAAPFIPGRLEAALPGVPQGRLLLAIPGDDDDAAQEAVAWLLHHNYSGRLGVKAIAETGLVYDMDSESTRRGPSLALFSMGADPAELARLEADLSQVLDGAAGGFTESEVAAYRTYADGRTAVRLAHPDQAARLWNSALLRGGDQKTPGRDADLAAALTPDAVAAAAARMLAADRRLVIVVGRAGDPGAVGTSD
jgi:predicted Zn-dependent peptidase